MPFSSLNMPKGTNRTPIVKLCIMFFFLSRPHVFCKEAAASAIVLRTKAFPSHYSDIYPHHTRSWIVVLTHSDPCPRLGTDGQSRKMPLLYISRTATKLTSHLIDSQCLTRKLSGGNCEGRCVNWDAYCSSFAKTPCMSRPWSLGCICCSSSC